MQNSINIKVDPYLSNPSTPELTNGGVYYEEVRTGKAKWYRCTYPDCSKGFRYKSEIIKHNATHSDYRPHYCTFEGCDKAFKRLDTLEAHLRIHTGSKPFACEFPGCSERFINKSSLYYHSLKHENTKNYKCKIPGCNKSFLTKALLNQHEKAIFYHMRISTPTTTTCPKKEEYEEPTKLVKKSSISDENTFTAEIKPQFYENSDEIVKPIQAFQVGFDDAKFQEGYKNLLDKLQRENSILKRALGIQFELMNHFLTGDIAKPQETILYHPTEGSLNFTRP